VAAAIDGACLVLGTELLSAMNLVTPGGVTVFWLVVCAVTFAIWRSGAVQGPIARPCAETSDEPLDVENKYLLSGAAILAVLIGVTALLAPPNVWDAMEYHLPRVVMWMSDRNVRFFPTPDYAQLVFGTWAEDAILHLDLLWGSDRLVNLVEFFSFKPSRGFRSSRNCSERTGAGRRSPPWCAQRYRRPCWKLRGR
jgi:hypothetical protein